MVLGFLGTLIALERAVALRSTLGYAAPALLGLGGLALAAGLPRTIGQVLLLDGTVALVAVLVALWRRRRDDPVTVEVLGASLAVLAALLWVRVDAAVVVPLLAGFVVLTIAAERVELARIHLPASAERVLVAVAALVASAAMAAVLFPDAGSRAFGLSLLVLVVWLAPRDVARRTVRGTGQPRFCAAAMLAGYAWLAVAGVAWAASGVTTTPAAHDVVVHTIFLGFVMSMVLAHAPVILPAVLRRPVPYRPLLWVPLVVLHAALLVRVAGDLAGRPVLVAVGGYGTAAALLLLPLAAVLTATLPSTGAPGTRGPPSPARSCGPDRLHQEHPVNPPTPPASRRTWPLRDRPGLVWLGLAAALTLVHRWVPGSDWLLVHLVLLGALTHSAMVWSTHFTQALLKTPPRSTTAPSRTAASHCSSRGSPRVLVGVPTGVWPLTVAGATAVSGAVLWHGIQLWRRLRRALPGRFRVTVRYYLAAAACVPVGATLGAWLARGLDDERHGAVLVAHSMVMVLGWIGLTVTGTLVTLWPTMLRTRMDARAERLARQALPVLRHRHRGARDRGGPGLSPRGPGSAWSGMPPGWSGGGAPLVAARAAGPAEGLRDLVGQRGARVAVVALALVGWRLATSPSWAAAGRRLRDRRRGRRGRLRRAAALRGAVPPDPVGARWRAVRGARGLGVARPRRALAGHRRQPRAARLPAPRTERRCASPCRCSCSARSSRSSPCCCARSARAVAARRACWSPWPTPPSAGCGPPRRAGRGAARPVGRQLLAAVASLALVVTLGIAADPAAAGLTEAGRRRRRPRASWRRAPRAAHRPHDAGHGRGPRHVATRPPRSASPTATGSSSTWSTATTAHRTTSPSATASRPAASCPAGRRPSTSAWSRPAPRAGAASSATGRWGWCSTSSSPARPARAPRSGRPRRRSGHGTDGEPRSTCRGTPGPASRPCPRRFHRSTRARTHAVTLDHRGGRARGGARGARRSGGPSTAPCPAHPARAGRRHLRGHPRQPRLDGPLDRLPRRERWRPTT